ncbi:MAG: hypothetical protein ACI9N9_002932 [Enterobacterales bacterium]|jgi:hypothetical protein
MVNATVVALYKKGTFKLIVINDYIPNVTNKNQWNIYDKLYS